MDKLIHNRCHGYRWCIANTNYFCIGMIDNNGIFAWDLRWDKLAVITPSCLMPFDNIEFPGHYWDGYYFSPLRRLSHKTHNSLMWILYIVIDAIRYQLTVFLSCE